MILKEILLCYIDLTMAAFELFDARGYYRKPIREYRDWRIDNKINTESAYKLRQRGFLRKTKNYYEFTPKGKKRVQDYIMNDLVIPKPKKWDTIWRFVIFDIPEEQKSSREIFRKKLKKLGLESVQKSVFCHPYDCIKEITFISKCLKIEPYVSYLEVSNVVTGKNIFKIFKDKNLL